MFVDTASDFDQFWKFYWVKFHLVLGWFNYYVNFYKLVDYIWYRIDKLG